MCIRDRPYAHHPGVQRMAGPPGARLGVQWRGERPPGVEVAPDPLTGTPPSGVRALVRRGVGEGRHEHGAQQMGQPPAPAVPQRARLLVPGVHADLHGGGGAHHGASGRAVPVEAGLHRVVARAGQQPAQRAARIQAGAAQDQALGEQYGSHGGQIGLKAVHAAGEGGGGGRAELQLAAGFDAEAGVQGQGAGGVVRGGQPLGRQWIAGPLGVQDEPFELGTEDAGRSCLETDAVDQLLGSGFGDRGRVAR